MSKEFVTLASSNTLLTQNTTPSKSERARSPDTLTEINTI